MKVATFLAALAAELNELGKLGMFSRQWILDGSWNKNSWLHSRMLGALTRSVARPFVAMPEVKWHRGFRPDLCIVNTRDITVAVIEYESTNSSDERLFDKDLPHFEHAIKAYAGTLEQLPQWWMLLTTLPDCKVRNSYSYDWRGSGHPPPTKSRRLRNANPLAYFKPYLHDRISATWKSIVAAFGQPPHTQIVWANLDEHGLSILHVNGRKPARKLRHLLALPEQ